MAITVLSHRFHFKRNAPVPAKHIIDFFTDLRKGRECPVGKGLLPFRPAICCCSDMDMPVGLASKCNR